MRTRVGYMTCMIYTLSYLHDLWDVYGLCFTCFKVYYLQVLCTYILGIRMGLSAPMADRPYLNSAVRPNELRDV